MAPSREALSKRGKVASLTRSRTPNDPELVAARRDLAAANIAEFIKKTVDKAPPLTAEQRTKLAELLRPARRGGGI